MGYTTADIVIIFDKFEKCWDTIDKETYRAGVTDDGVATVLKLHFRRQIKSFIADKLQNKIFRHVVERPYDLLTHTHVYRSDN